MFTSTDVSVIIPSFGSRGTILHCLKSLYEQEELPAEVIVADSSEDDTVALIHEHYPQVITYKFEHRTFPGPARNKGTSLARGSIVAFIDADCLAAPDWVKRMAAQHSAGHQIVGGAVEVGNSKSLLAWAGHLGEFREFLPTGPERMVSHVPTCNISYRKALIETYGGFPNAYYPQEDMLFNYLLARNGYRVWFDPAIRVRHFCRESLHGYLSHQHRVGRVTRVTLTRIEMEGSRLARRPWLAWAASPALGVVKYFRNLGIFWRSMPQEAIRRPALVPLLLLGSIWWARGFAAGALTGLSGLRGMIDPEEDIFILFDQPPTRPTAIETPEFIP
ncbi:MAG: glycosyltransferase [Chloroflexota bacterium]